MNKEIKELINYYIPPKDLPKVTKYIEELEKEIEFLKMQRESLESQLQHYRGYN